MRGSQRTECGPALSTRSAWADSLRPGTESVLPLGRRARHHERMEGYADYCPIAVGVTVLGDRWTPLVIRELMVGAGGFNEIHRGIPRISRTMLAQRLRLLERHGLVCREPGPRGRPGRYALTPAGTSVIPTRTRETGLPGTARPTGGEVRTIRARIGILRAGRPDVGVAVGHLSRHPRGFRVEMRVTLLAGCGGDLENRRDLLDLVQFACGDLHDQIVGLVVGERQAAAVEAVEGDRRCEREPLVAVDQGMVACQRVQQRGCLGIEGRVGVLAERRGLGAGEGGFEQPVIADRNPRPEDAPGDVQQFRERQVDHWPSRSSASAYLGSSSSSTLSSSSARLWFSTYSRIA